jgi:hypothetical protein
MSTTVTTLGQSFEKPSAYFRPTAQAISSNPATMSQIQGMGQE